MQQQFILGLIILLSLITTTGLPWQICHKIGQPYLVNLFMAVVIILIHLWVGRGGIFFVDKSRLWKRMIPVCGLLIWSIICSIFIHPHGFRIEDGWFFAVGLCFLLDQSPLKQLLQRTIITMSPLSIISIYGWLCPSSVLTAMLVIAFAITFFSPLSPIPINGASKGTEKDGEGKYSCLCVFVVKYLPIVVSFAAVIIISLHFLIFDPGVKKQGRILFDIGHGDTSGPQWGYNTDIDKSADAGHGRLLDFLKAYGYRALTSAKPLTHDVLKKYDILLLVMSSHAYTRQEINNIKKFVRDGGGLMVIGDHTNVDDVMASLNPVLEGFNVGLKFDIVRVDKSIKANIFTAHCPMFQGVNPAREVAIGNGASLSVSLPAIPILNVGYGAFSDIGDLKTGPDQAYLGNGILDKGEKVGDHIIAASSKYGKGRLIVFGDSSYFQNLALYRNYKFCYQCFDWLNRMNLSHRDAWFIFSTFFTGFSIFAILLLLPVAMIIYGQGIQRRIGYGIIPAIIIAQCIAFVVNNQSYPALDHKKLGQRVLFDFSHYPQHRTYWEDSDNYPTSLDSLVHQTLRVGLHPSLKYKGRLSAQELKGYDALVVSSPNLPYTRQEVQDIQQWVSHGGGLLVLEGARKETIINDLLKPFKIQLEDKPLGTYYCQKDTDGNDFKIPMSFTTQRFIKHPITQGIDSIWFMTPVVVKGGIPIAHVYDYPTMAYKKYDAGRVVVVGDNLFFANYISEGEKGIVDYDKVYLNWNVMRWLTGISS
ncbi:MAG: DUF4350 domain-containing protein [bacterium]|nr:DUF4350 domain-containing protein [bacterium]